MQRPCGPCRAPPESRVSQRWLLCPAHVQIPQADVLACTVMCCGRIAARAAKCGMRPARSNAHASRIGRAERVQRAVPAHSLPAAASGTTPSQHPGAECLLCLALKLGCVRDAGWVAWLLQVAATSQLTPDRDEPALLTCSMCVLWCLLHSARRYLSALCRALSDAAAALYIWA